MQRALQPCAANPRRGGVEQSTAAISWRDFFPAGDSLPVARKSHSLIFQVLKLFSVESVDTNTLQLNLVGTCALIVKSI